MSMFNAQDWKGKEWLVFLCAAFLSLAAIYCTFHFFKSGHEYVQLGKRDIQNISNIFADYQEPAQPDTTNYTAYIRTERNAALVRYMTVELHNVLDTGKLHKQESVLLYLSNKDAISYLNDAKFLCYGYFWLSGPEAYWEVIFWALFGVLTSLIYYVSLANRNTLNNEAGDVGLYDASEIPSQVGKMFYAPMCTLVLVLGYGVISKEVNMIDISAGKGLILFSFICGFFSGRVMKFMDRLKDLILPVTDTPKTAAATTTATGSVSVDVQLAASLAQSAQGTEITEGGFNSATVTMLAADGTSVALQNPADDQSSMFLANNVAAGAYTITATMNFKNDSTIINLASPPQSVTVVAGENNFTVLLDTGADEG